jgi:hypothetical protein
MQHTAMGLLLSSLQSGADCVLIVDSWTMNTNCVTVVQPQLTMVYDTA